MNNGFVLIKGGKMPDRLLDWNGIQYKDYILKYNPIPKFLKDKLFFETENFIILLDGVIFNNNVFMNEERKSWQETVKIKIAKEGIGFINKLRGSFCGLYINKKSCSLTAFSNHSGEKAVYYFRKKNMLVLASNMTLIKEILDCNTIQYEVNIQSANEMLVTGSILHGNTILKDVRRITAGKYIVVTDDHLMEKRYHIFKNIPEHQLSLAECVDTADKLFRQAVKRIFEKNSEYGYKSEADLSGGLDSRLVTWVAHDLGFTNFLNLCYCQKGKIDNLTSKNIAQDINNEYFFYPMDGGSFLKDVDEMTAKTGGQVVYCLCTGANRALNSMDLSQIGLTVTGLLGEIHNAYWVEGELHTPPKYTNIKYSYTIPLDIPDEYSKEYDNYEQMNLYEYSCLFYLSSAFARQDKVEVYSPFVDVDYLDFAYKIPLKWRRNYYFTMTWYMKKYPEAAKYVWQTKLKPVSYEYTNSNYLPAVKYVIQDFYAKCYNNTMKKLQLNSRLGYIGDMNNFQLWYEQNPDLRKWLQMYYDENIKLVSNDYIRNRINELYFDKKNLCRDKLLAINLISIIKFYFN